MPLAVLPPPPGALDELLGGVDAVDPVSVGVPGSTGGGVAVSDVVSVGVASSANAVGAAKRAAAAPAAPSAAILVVMRRREDVARGVNIRISPKVPPSPHPDATAFAGILVGNGISRQ